MLRKNKMDPSRINNYNKFLITLDKSLNEVIKPEVINEDPTNDPSRINNYNKFLILKTDQLLKVRIGENH
jgi:uncharacterized phage-like protein YoqJ